MLDQEQEIVEDSEPERVLHRNSQESAGTSSESSQILIAGLVSSNIINLTDEEQDVVLNQSLPAERALNIPKRVISERRCKLIPKDLPFSSDVCGAVDGSSDEEKIIDLSRFAYSNSPPSMAMTSSATPTAASLVIEPKRKPNTAKVRPHKAHSLVDGLSDSHFAKLTKCVSCDTRWTTRKTIGQKMKHIKSCAKKNGLTVETIRVAVLREIAITKAAIVIDSTEKEAEKSCGSEAAPTTLLKNTVDAVAAGKGAHRRLPKTVQCVTQTRGAILERAKEVLLHSAQITEYSDLLQMDTAGDDKDQPPSTQPFGQSTFACGRVLKSELFAAASSDVTTKGECQLEPEYSGTTHRLRHGNGNLTHARSLYVGPPRRETKEKRDCDASRWNDTSERLARKNALASRDDTNVEPSQKDEQWMQQFKSLILQDRNLYLSILHYEPIHIDVFRTLAEANGLKTIKFKTLLRGFLDREAIHYYGAEPQGSRTRKD